MISAQEANTIAASTSKYRENLLKTTYKEIEEEISNSCEKGYFATRKTVDCIILEEVLTELSSWGYQCRVADNEIEIRWDHMDGKIIRLKTEDPRGDD